MTALTEMSALQHPIVRGLAWPAAYPGSALRNRYIARWDGRESDLSAALVARISDEAQAQLRAGARLAR